MHRSSCRVENSLGHGCVRGGGERHRCDGCRDQWPVPGHCGCRPEHGRAATDRVQGARLVQLSFPPNDPRLGNVHRAPQVLPDVLALGEHPPSAHGMPVRDLAVTADHDQVYLVSPSCRCVVEPVVVDSLVRHQWPALARLLFEIPRARSAAVSLFDWGPAQTNRSSPLGTGVPGTPDRPAVIALSGRTPRWLSPDSSSVTVAGWPWWIWSMWLASGRCDVRCLWAQPLGEVV